MTQIVDKIGQPITAGCYIAYGHALGLCAAIRLGKVLRVAHVEKEWSDKPVLRITVQGIEDGWGGRPPKLVGRKGTLMFPDRMIVLDPATLPKAIFALLDPIPVLKPTKPKA